MAGDYLDCSVAAAEERWHSSPLWHAMVDALTDVGLAGAERVVARMRTNDTNHPLWPHPDRAVRDEFHARWTQRVFGWLLHEEWSAAVRARCGRTQDAPIPAPGAYTNGLPPKLTDAERTAIVVRYQAGESRGALAECFEVSHTTIANVLAWAGVPMRAKGAAKRASMQARRDEAVRRYRAGETRVTAIATAMGADYGTVARYLRDAGIVIDVRAAKRQGGRNRWARLRGGIRHQEAA